METFLVRQEHREDRGAFIFKPLVLVMPCSPHVDVAVDAPQLGSVCS